MIEVNVHRQVMLIGHVLETLLRLCGRPPQTRIVQNSGPVLLNTAKTVETQGSLRNYRGQEAPKETWCRKVVWCPGWALRTEIGH